LERPDKRFSNIEVERIDIQGSGVGMIRHMYNVGFDEISMPAQ
jgi:hypothetical protein